MDAGEPRRTPIERKAAQRVRLLAQVRKPGDGVLARASIRAQGQDPGQSQTAIPTPPNREATHPAEQDALPALSKEDIGGIVIGHSRGAGVQHAGLFWSKAERGQVEAASHIFHRAIGRGQ